MDEEINQTLFKAKQMAIDDAKIFGIIDFQDIDEFQIRSRINLYSEEESSDEENEICFEMHELDVNHNEVNEESGEDIFEDGIRKDLVKVIDENGVERIIRKSTYVWMLTDPSVRLSNDRLRRFQSTLKKRKIDNDCTD